MKFFQLNFRRLLLIKGCGSKQFLQGLITKDIEILNDTNQLIYTFLLNVKGRIFVDMFIWRLTNILESGIEAYALEIDSKKLDIFQKVLNIYKLRRPITIESLPKHRVCFSSSFNVLQTKPSSSTIINWTPDPRVLNFGYRSLIENSEENSLKNVQNSEKEYIAHRYKWGIGEGIEIIDQIPLAMNGDLLNGISFEKGCYIGQELISRTYHSGIVRRRLMPFRWLVNDTLLTNEITEDLVLKDEKFQRQGKLISSNGENGLCLVSVGLIPENTSIRLFDSNNRVLEVWRPEWWPKI